MSHCNPRSIERGCLSETPFFILLAVLSLWYEYPRRMNSNLSTNEIKVILDGAKGQSISKGNLVFSNLPKTQRNFVKNFCPSL